MQASSVKLLFGGDVTLGHRYQEYLDGGRHDSQDDLFAYGFRRLRPVIDAADMFVVNLEGPLASVGTPLEKPFRFRARPEHVETLRAAGIDAVSLANNHAMDYGADALADTRLVLERAAISHFGAGPNLRSAREPLFLSSGGMRFAFLGYLYLGRRAAGEPPEMFATTKAAGVAGHRRSRRRVRRMVSEDVAAAAASADHVVLFFHWGQQLAWRPHPDQVILGRAAVHAGASLVVGTHPHAVQGIELYRGVPIVYSLGNLVFGGNRRPRDTTALLYGARFSADGVISQELIPIHTGRPRFRPMQPYVRSAWARRCVFRRLRRQSAHFPHTIEPLRGRR